MLQSMNVIVRKASGDENAVLGLRMAWAVLSGGGLETQLVYVHDGVFNLLGVPGYMGQLLGRFIEEGGVVRAVRQSLLARGLTEEMLVKGVTIIDSSDMADVIQDADGTATF